MYPPDRDQALLHAVHEQRVLVEHLTVVRAAALLRNDEVRHDQLTGANRAPSNDATGLDASLALEAVGMREVTKGVDEAGWDAQGPQLSSSPRHRPACVG
jgi:hypothetical protein